MIVTTGPRGARRKTWAGVIRILVFMLACHSAAHAQRLPPVPAAAQAAPRALSTKSAPADWLVQSAARWMSGLPDSTPLGSLSIPGTHDSGARFGGYLCQTQSWTLERMLMAGVRYFDIRNRRSGNVFAIHHGLCFQKMTFGNVLETMNRFLDTHPSEGVIMRIKEEHTPAPGSLPFAEIWAKHMAAGGRRIAPAATAPPALGGIRGKIFVLRDAAFEGAGIAWSHPSIKLQDIWQVYDSQEPHPYGADTVSIDGKLRLIREWMFEAAENNPGGKSLFLNHLSGATGVTPIDMARRANQDAFDQLAEAERKPLGILIMDFPGENLIHRILRTNFAE